MNLPIDRDSVIQAFIALILCVGAWMFLVEPGARELSELDAISTAQLSIAASIDFEDLHESADKAPMIRQRSRTIFAAGNFSADSSALYERITALSKVHDVKVKNLRPGVERQMGSGVHSFVATRIDMTVVGEYEHIAMFLDAMDEIGAYLRPVSVQIAPSKKQGDSPTVMQLGFEAIRFHLPESLMVFVETDS